jgi:cytochrome P450
LYEELKLNLLNEKEFNIQSIDKCLLLDSVVKETLRIRGPILLAISRDILKDIKIGKYVIKKGSFV